MNKMRENTAIILWILVISFGGLWVLQDSGAFDNIGLGMQTNVAEVNGEPISYRQYTTTLESYVQQYQAQTGEAITTQMREQYADMVFNSLVDNVLLEQEIARLGISVSNEEVYEMVMGEHPDPIIREQFGDGEGGINRALLLTVIEDESMREQWVQLEEYLRAKRRQEKLESLLASTVRISNQDVIDEHMRRNRRVDAEFVALRYADIPDDSVQITDRDLRTYYNRNREDFLQPRTWTIDYVRLPKTASTDDSLQIVNELQNLRESFEEAENDSVFLAQFGVQRGLSRTYFRADEMDEQVAGELFTEDLTPGSVIGPIVVEEEARLVKVRDVRPADESAVRARHILFGIDPEDEASRAFAREQAQEVRARLEAGEDFTTLARQYSDDPGSGQRGGDLGWFGPGAMVRPFEEAAFAAPVGRVVGPVETTFGFHLIQVQNRATQEVQVAELSMSLVPADAGVSRLIDQAEDIRYYGRRDFAGEVRGRGHEVHEARVQEGQRAIPDLGMSRAILNFLERSRRGAISEPIELDDAVVVVHLREVRPEGHRSFEEVRAEIEPRVRLERKRQMQAERLRRAAEAGDLNAVAQRAGATIRPATNLTLANPFVSGLGREPRFVGTAMGLREGETSGVVEGETHAFILRTTRVEEPNLAQFTDEQREQLRSQMLEQRRQTVLNRWITSLRENAEIRDFRYRFER